METQHEKLGCTPLGVPSSASPPNCPSALPSPDPARLALCQGSSGTRLEFSKGILLSRLEKTNTAEEQKRHHSSC